MLTTNIQVGGSRLYKMLTEVSSKWKNVCQVQFLVVRRSDQKWYAFKLDYPSSPTLHSDYFTGPPLRGLLYKPFGENT